MKKGDIDIIAKLRAKHATAGNDGWGIEIFQGKARDNYKTGVIEPRANIETFIKSATELAILILKNI